MRRPIRLLLWLVAAVVLVVAVVIVSQTLIRPNVSNPIERLEYSQYRATPDFDASTYTVTSGPRIQAFQSLVKKYKVDIADFNAAENDGCTGGLATSVTLYTAGNKMQKLNLYSCRGPKARGTFVADATALFTKWHAIDEAKATPTPTP